jgi:hypothetical protein
MMIAVAVVAGLLGLPGEWGFFVIVLSLACLAWIGPQWLVIRGRRRVAAFGFWILASLTNLLYGAACVAPDRYLLIPLFLGWLIVLAPTIGGLGVAWARLATREGAVPLRSPPATWLTVIALSVMPLVTLWTLWPLRLAFLAARPALERLADRVTAGQTAGFPEWVGPFRLARSAVDPVSGNVGLMIDPISIGRPRLVRVRPGMPQARTGPFGWDDLCVELGWGWEYREED